MSELGAVADLLESSGEPGLAAAVRVLEYCEAREIPVNSVPDPGEVKLSPLIDLAGGRLRALGHPEMADRLRDVHDDLVIYGHVLHYRTGGSPTIADPDGVLARHPAIREGIHDWVADPAPKLPGLAVSARLTDTYGSMQDAPVDLVLECRRAGHLFRRLRQVDGAHRPETYPVPDRVFGHLESLHERLVDDIREHPG